MLPHVERMVIEREELSEKVTKLEEFILNNPVFGALPEYKRILLEKQFEAMVTYEGILTERISLER